MLYVHIPFCKQLCAYCDFYFSVSLARKEQILAALLREMEERRDYLSPPLFPSTLYVGGGTPSVFTPDELHKLITKAKEISGTAAFSELTVEVNPDDITPEYAAQLLAIGVNRLSVGIQSFHDHQLQRLRRRHSAFQAVESVKIIQAAGCQNITIDLMYGLPQQTTDEWREDVAMALSLDVPHISAYHLSIEPDTLFGKQYKKGLLHVPDEETGLQQYAYLHHALAENGYEHYEVSNFARKGCRAIHNSGYWKGFPYMGIGPSAHSYNGESRQWNVANNMRYLEAMEKGKVSFEKEDITTCMRFNEYLLTALRTIEGIDLQYISDTFGRVYQQHLIQQAQPYLAAGKLLQTDATWHIPPLHFMLSDGIIRDLFFI